MKQVEVYILSGFLGAGKTTLLKNILEQERDQQRKIAVVMNELGKVSIDSQAVSEDTPLKELLNGCVCCTIQGQLEAHLQGLLQQHELDAIYIETTGVAHPVEVLDSCMSPLFADKLVVRSIVTLVDVLRWRDRDGLSIQLQRLLQEQVKHADVVLLNKSDQLTDSEQASLVLEIQNLNQQGKILLTQFARIQLKQIQEQVFTPKNAHEEVNVHTQLHVKTYVHSFSRPINLDSFEDFLKAMPDTIYRIKGYLKFDHGKDTYLFQYSYGMPLYMKEPMNMKNTLVFIGENLDHEWLKRELEKLEAI
ncbi:CobW family GTP-binding protein [Metabacillus herbersteinensis]|uniref:CobW family GTP-binding protein n=1 Tax=Metabacillus herbersteinensis TaxID=283816 RepID=A0ABV6GAS5_9BACI